MFCLKDVALTAAHCCSDVPVESMTIDAGGIDRITLEGMQRIGVERKIVHEDYNPRLIQNDICLLLLEDSFDYSDG